ncbi:MAG: PepSY-like domain-containing protein [Chitinophagaceae bacterium]
MKKKILLALFVGGAVAVAVAQKLKASAVPAAVKSSFAKSYPGITAKWEMEAGKYEAGFKKNGSDMSVLFEKNGTMTESETDIKTTDLPATVLAYVAAHYKGKKINEAAKITTAAGVVTFEAEVGDTDVIFDASGKFLKEVKEPKENKEGKD